MTKIRTDWKKYIEGIRQREIDLILPYIQNKKYEVGIEIGSGNGFQSRILSKHIKLLNCTELNEDRLEKKNVKNIKYIIADAEIINKYFDEDSCDFIYSSNVLEHLPNPKKAIIGMKKILKINALTIHIIPSPFNVLTRLLLWYPNFLLSVVEYFFANQKENKNQVSVGNNIKSKRSKKGKWRKIILPQSHGVSRNIFTEILDMNKQRWISYFKKEGFSIINVIKGPVNSGYGFGFKNISTLLERLGLTSEYIYVMKKNE